MARVAAENRLHFRPLWAYVEARGGLAHLIAKAELQSGGAVARTLRNQLDRARIRGWISALTADRILLDFYGRLAHEVYGAEWWSPTYSDGKREEPTDQEARYDEDPLERVISIIRGLDVPGIITEEAA